MSCYIFDRVIFVKRPCGFNDCWSRRIRADEPVLGIFILRGNASMFQDFFDKFLKAFFTCNERIVNTIVIDGRLKFRCRRLMLSRDKDRDYFLVVAE